MTRPTSIAIRMYNVGFGDCFLLKFHYPDRTRHVLIDFGSTAAPQRAAKDHMTRIANRIVQSCGGELDILVATHRHSDHINGFATGSHGPTGKIIAALKPQVVIQPWTEDPAAPPSGEHAGFLDSLNDMHRIAASASALFPAEPGRRTKSNQIGFLGQENLRNASAVNNLIAMGRQGSALYVHAGMQLNNLLPGVRITVLGPPTLAQSDEIRKQRAKDPDQFWAYRRFWEARANALEQRTKGEKKPLFPNAKTTQAEQLAPNVRWFIRQTREIEKEQTLQIVRELDGVLNNTSVILLFETGNRKLLFPGDAQIENWSYALSQPEWLEALKDVNVYKVGHHGSRNATPKTLWDLFGKKGPRDTPARLKTLCSTRRGKHPDVPRKELIAALQQQTELHMTESH